MSRSWIAIAVILSFAAVAVLLGSVRMSQKMQVAAQGDGGTTFRQEAPGSHAKVVMEIAAADSNSIRGYLLESSGTNSYRRTANGVRALYDEKTKIVMGGKLDIHPGAVIHVSGTVTQERELEAQQLVVLTGYVKVQ